MQCVAVHADTAAVLPCYALNPLEHASVNGQCVKSALAGRGGGVDSPGSSGLTMVSSSFAALRCLHKRRGQSTAIVIASLAAVQPPFIAVWVGWGRYTQAGTSHACMHLPHKESWGVCL